MDSRIRILSEVQDSRSIQNRYVISRVYLCYDFLTHLQNFWPFVSKFSHRNVLSQIKRLTQIKNDIGRARVRNILFYYLLFIIFKVWVRITLNEGVMEHYISAFARDRPSVRYGDI
jgi:hypothetical protein